jgi:ABC-type sugar transport system permease subunit/ABC-type glycerol-3-phosphate transport system substrate-binding protein
MNGWVKGGLVGAISLTVLWLLWPKASDTFAGEGVVEISYMSPDGPIRDAFEDAIREFEFISRRRHEETGGDYPIYRVVAGQSASRNQTEDPTRFLLSLVGGSPPDVVFFDRFAISEWAARGAFAPLDNFVARDQTTWAHWQITRKSRSDDDAPWPGAKAEAPRAEGAQPLAAVEPIRQEDYYTACWDEAVYRNPLTGESGLYGIPNSADDRVLLYNKDILVRYGYTNDFGEARPPATWEELEEMSVRMIERDESGNIRKLGFIPNFGNAWLYFYGWMAGGKFMSEDKRTVTLNDPHIVYALEYMTRLYEAMGGAREVLSFESTFQRGALDPFVVGKVAMKIDGDWTLTSLARFGRDLNFGAAPAPMPARELAKGREPVTWMGGWAYAIPSTSPRKDHAWELIRFLVSQRSLEIRMASEQYSQLAQGRPYFPRQFPNRVQNNWVYEQYIVNNLIVEQKFKDAAQVFHAVMDDAYYRPVTPVGQKLWKAHKDAMEEGIHQKRSPQEALDYHTASVQRELDRFLHPPEGKSIQSWTWFFWLYGAILVGAVLLIYRLDTRKTGARKGSFLLRLFGGDEKDASPSIIEGKKGSYFRSEWKYGVLCALPWILGFALFTGGPLLFSIVISFCRYDILNQAEFVGLSHYIRMLVDDELFWKSVWNTVFMAIGIPIGMVVGLGIAILLTTKAKAVALWRTLFYLPSIVPLVAASILWIWIFNPQSGLLNQMLGAIGVDNPPFWLNDEHTSKWALILMGLWGAGGGMIIWIAGLKGISESYYEAASIDGANAWQKFCHVTIPQLTPYIFFNLIMGLIGTFQIFTQAFIMTEGGPVNSTLFYVYYLFNNAFRYLNMGYACAMAWFLFVIVCVLTMYQLRLSRRWVHYEGD